MNIKAEKISLIEKLLHTEDESMIKELKQVFLNKKNDFWDELPVKVQEEIEQAIIETDNGDYIPHEDMIKKYEKWLKR